MNPVHVAAEFLPLAVLATSLAGSGHCAGMCSGLVLSSGASTRPGAWLQYHSGRGLTYAALGALAGGVGALGFGFRQWPWLQSASAVLMAGILITSGIQFFREGKPLEWGVLSGTPRMFRGLSRILPKKAFFMGILTAFLPCGWLHLQLISSALTQSPLRGALWMGVFWLGTLPALSVAPWGIGQLSRRVSAQSAQRVVGITLVSFGLLTLAAKVQFMPFSTALVETPALQCHP